MRLADLPRLTIDAVEAGRCIATFEPSKWMGEGWIGYVYVDGQFIDGRFVEVDQTARRCGFRPDDPDQLGALRPAHSHPYFEGYWGQRAALVLDSSREWQAKRFAARDAVEFTTESGRVRRTMSDQESARLYRGDPPESAIEGGRVVPGGWDHEHCDICWETIDDDTLEAFFSPRARGCVPTATYGS